MGGKEIHVPNLSPSKSSIVNTVTYWKLIFQQFKNSTHWKGRFCEGIWYALRCSCSVFFKNVRYSIFYINVLYSITGYVSYSIHVLHIVDALSNYMELMLKTQNRKGGNTRVYPRFQEDEGFTQYLLSGTLEIPPSDWAADPAHRLVSTDERKLRPCYYCSLTKVKTKSGWRKYTRHKCELCNIPFCKRQQGCFYLYHRALEIFYEEEAGGEQSQTREYCDTENHWVILHICRTPEQVLPASSWICDSLAKEMWEDLHVVTCLFV